ncbi:hypothetical protein [Dyadobacter koreensis]|uniref:hypothetical protein n=1 Tax=Dyadobacter koreensis TaxID=408657 RepID=UPI0015A5A830|nr:hypothetical protein [Dyadobacter koreensis]
MRSQFLDAQYGLGRWHYGTSSQTKGYNRVMVNAALEENSAGGDIHCCYKILSGR